MKSNVSPESVAAVTVMAVTAANVAKTMNPAKQVMRPRLPLSATQHPLIQNQNKLWGRRHVRKMLQKL